MTELLGKSREFNLTEFKKQVDDVYISSWPFQVFRPTSPCDESSFAKLGRAKSEKRLSGDRQSIL
jgi:hypothetical protein